MIGNARWVPFYLGSEVGDELAPVSSALQQAQLFDGNDYRYRLEIYTDRDHASWAATGTFDGALAWLQQNDAPLRSQPPQIKYAWYAEHQKPVLGTGPGTVYWLTSLQATGHTPGFVASVEARSGCLQTIKPTTVRSSGPVLNADGPAAYQELQWAQADAASSGPSATLQLNLHGVQAVGIQLRHAGFAAGSAGTINVESDGPATLILQELQAASPVIQHDHVAHTDSGGQLSIAVASGKTQLSFGRLRQSTIQTTDPCHPISASDASQESGLPKTTSSAGMLPIALLLALGAVVAAIAVRVSEFRPRWRG
jgi:hypothetical protein